MEDQYRKLIRSIVEEAEQRVLAVLADEAHQARYEGIEFSKAVAVRLKKIREELSSEIPPLVQNEAPSNDGVKASVRGSRERKPAYPRFEIADGYLIKVGWSKKKKDEYCQRIPRSAFDRVVRELNVLADEGGRSTSDAILDRVDNGGEPVPSYQVYGVLRFLRERNIIKTLSRGEYSLPSDVELQARSEFEREAI